MFNKETYENIRSIPHIKGISIKDLPQFLTKVYAQIITLKENQKNIIAEDYEKLGILANTLEIIVLTGDINDNLIKNAAFVGASARQLLDMISKDNQNPDISLYTIPYSVSATLMFTISGQLADAQEMSKRISYDFTTTPWSRDLLWGIKTLIRGKLQDLSSTLTPTVDYTGDIDNVAENLIFAELFDSLKEAAEYFLGYKESLDAIEKIEKIKNISIYDIPEFNQKEIFTGVFILSSLLKNALIILSELSCMNVPSPAHINLEVWKSNLKELVKAKPFLWNNHLEAINKGYLNKGVSSVVTFPTGAGKSMLINLKILSSLVSGKSVIYIVPTHALERQVTKDMKALSSSVSEFANMDSEISNLESSEEVKIAIMTPERCLTRIALNSENLLNNVGLIVFDEFHLISGKEDDRRAPVAMSVLVELLFRIPEADYLLSSAMVKNGEEIRKWIESASEHQCILLDNAWKPTSQLQGCIVYSTTEESELRQKINAFKRSGITSQSKHMKMHLWMTPYCLFSLKSIWDSLYVDDYYFTQILNRKVQLKLNDRYALTPNCNEVAAEIASKFSMNRKKVIIFVLQPNYANSICNRLDSIYKRYGYTIQDINWNVYQDKVSAIEAELGGWEYSYLSKCTVATPHHALLLDYERAISEDLFVNSSLIDVIVATPTISQGVNLPSDIVIIAGSARFNPDKEEREQIKAHDLLNAVGRAGRAGYRSHGAAILIPSSIIVYENYKIHENWMKLREEIFSQGDRCLEIEDPLSFIFNGEVTNDSNPIILKIQGNESELEKKFKKTFFYYQHSKSNIELRSIAKNLIAVRKNDSKNIDWCSELAIQLGLKESYIYLIDKTIDKDILNNSESLSIFDMINLIRDLFIRIPQIIYGTLLLAITESELQQLLGIKNMDGFSTKEEYIDYIGSLICDIMEKYVEGASILNLEKMVLPKRKSISKNLDRGRKIGLRLIPSLSYLCGIIGQIFINKAIRLGDRKLSEEVLYFASCIKEGVTTKQMLLSKIQNGWMRVETHNNFRNI